jgi:hypothetical protein
MRIILMIPIIVLLIMIPVNAGDAQLHITSDPPWTCTCGVNADHACSNGEIASHTSESPGSFFQYSQGQNVSGYIVAALPYHSENEQVIRHSFMISPSGETETFTEISGLYGSPHSSSTDGTCQSFLSGNTSGPGPELMGAIHAADAGRYPPRGIVRSKDIVVRDYPGIARVCSQTSVYWDNDESDRTKDYFSADTLVVISPVTDPEGKNMAKNREMRFSYNFSQDPARYPPLQDNYVIFVGPGGSTTFEAMANPTRSPQPVPWYEYLGLKGLFGSSVILGSDVDTVYSWHISTGFLSLYSDRPVAIHPGSEFVISQADGRDGLPYRIFSTEFNGTRGWCATTNGGCRESPDNISTFGSVFDLVWAGNVI